MRSSALPIAAMASSSTTRCAGCGKTEEAEGNREAGGRASQLAQVTPVRLGPRTLAGVTVAVAEQESFALRPPAPQVLHRVGPRPAEIAHGFVARLRHMDRGQFTRPVQARELEGVAPIGLDPLAWPRGDQRGRHDRAGNLQLPQSPREDKAGRPRFIADPQLDAGMGLPEFGEDLLQGVQIMGDGAVTTSESCFANKSASPSPFPIASQPNAAVIPAARGSLPDRS